MLSLPLGMESQELSVCLLRERIEVSQTQWRNNGKPVKHAVLLKSTTCEKEKPLKPFLCKLAYMLAAQDLSVSKSRTVT